MTLFEQIAATGLAASAVALSSAALVSVATLAGGARQNLRGLVRDGQIERLLDSALSPPAATASVVTATPTLMIVTADLDGDGHIDERSAETTTFEIVDKGQGRMLRHGLGRQTMKLAEGLHPESRLAYLDRAGGPTASAAEVAAVIIVAGERRWVSSLPAPP